MKRFSSLLIVFAIIVVGVGFYRGWFTVSGGREAETHKVDVNLTVDTDKVKEDVETVKDKATELTGKTTDGATELGREIRATVKPVKE